MFQAFTITSGKGGVGKTTLAVNLGISLALLNRETYILDADIGMANMALILGIDKFMSEARAITNQIGNSTAAVLMAIWEGEIDWAKFRAELAAGSRTSF